MCPESLAQPAGDRLDGQLERRLPNSVQRLLGENQRGDRVDQTIAIAVGVDIYLDRLKKNPSCLAGQGAEHLLSWLLVL